MSFDSLGLSDAILKAVAKQGYDTPTPIQAQAIPAILSGHDVMAAAQTGTGKTAGFTLPLLEKLSHGKPPRANQVRALVLTPTRELAAQVSDSVLTYGSNLSLRSAVVFGGVNINPQMLKLRKGVDILVATPGRLLDLHTKNALKLDQVEVFVLDEADRMLDMGFINDIRKVIALLPRHRQNLLFSATFSREIRELAKGLINDPVEISVSPQNTAAKTVEQLVIPVDKEQKTGLLIKLIKQHKWYQVLVFCRTKHGANRLAQKLIKSGISAAPIHGNKSQGARTRALAEFKKGDIQVLVATDIAARGIDIDQLPQVVNFDLPHVAEDYVHRIGRTGRAGAEGKAVSLVCADEAKELMGIERLIQQVLPRDIVPGFEAKAALPESPSKLKPLKPKKPKKNKSKSEHHDGPRSDKASAKKAHSNEGANTRTGHAAKPKRSRKPNNANKQTNQSSDQSAKQKPANNGAVKSPRSPRRRPAK
jgi:ATP-dependent RNA helicase RhlE